MRVGVGFSEDVPLGAQQPLAAAVEAAGLASLWSNEARGRDALATCQAWAQATERLLVGTAVVPVWTRSPAQLAAAAATLQEASGGRLLLGVGVSHPATMQRWHGADWRAPLTAARESLTLLRTLLAGDTTDQAGEVFSSQGFRLHLNPLPPAPPLYLAAMGPRMLALAGTHADGVLLNWASPDEVGRAAAAVRTAAAGAGRDPAAVEVATYVRVAVDPDRGAARAALARELGGYCALPNYAAHLERQGFGAAVAALRGAHRDGRDPGGAVGDAVLGQLGWWGRPDDDPAGMLAAYADAGLDHLIARVVVAGDDPAAALRHTLEVLAVS